MNSSDNPVDYYQEKVFEYELAGKHILISTKPGLPHWLEITPAEELLAEAIQINTNENILLLGCGNGGLGAKIASEILDGKFSLSDTNWIALECTRRTMELNGVVNPTIIRQPSLLPENQSSFTRVVIVLPKGRKLARRWLVEAFHLLRPEGQLYLAGANDDGIQSVSKDAASVMGTPGTVLGYKKGNRCVLFSKKKEDPIPTWSQEAGIAPGTWYCFDIHVGQIDLRVYSLPGVFSYNHLDDGTAFLLQHLEIYPGERILDLGCGYGILGLAAFRKMPDYVTRVDLVDCNLLAVASAKKTLAENSTLEEKEVFHIVAGDLMKNLRNEQYSLVLTNPPFHTGKAVDYGITQALIQDAQRVLTVGGRILLVANRFIRYEVEMKRYFSNVVVLASNNRYHILTAQKG